MSGSPWPAPRPGDGVATAVANAVLRGTRLPAPQTGSLRVARVDGPGPEPAPIPEGAPERSVGVDETNTSVIVGDRLVVKVIAAWQSAERSARMLETLSGSALTPAYFGSVVWDVPGRGSSVAALVSEYLEGRTDGWTWAVDDVLHGIDGGPRPAWPAALGIRTAHLHAVLAGDAVPLPVDAAALRTDAAAAVEDARRLGRAVDRPRIDRLDAIVRALPDGLEAPAFALHGDLHVGQFLRAPQAPPGDPASYAVIDFDGDPQDLADAAHVAAKDLAHLRVSVWAVAAVAARRRADATERLVEWARAASDDLTSAYSAALTAEHRELGQSAPGFQLLLAHFEAEQVAREVTYAARFLPAFAYASEFLLVHRYGTDGERTTPR